MVTVTFTKKFTSDSFLSGLTYETSVEFTHINGPGSEQERAEEYVTFLEKHTNKPVKACAGSAYTVLADSIEVTYA